MDKSNLVIRSLSGIVFAVVVVGAILLSRYSFGALMVLVCLGSMGEFFNIVEATGARPQRGFGVISAGIVVVMSFMVVQGIIAPIFLVSLIAIPAIVFVRELYRDLENPLGNIASTITGLIYIAVPLSLLFLLAIHKPAFLEGSHREYYPWLILSYIFIVWSNDVGAYLVGVTCGKHRLFERISPKKSWEGFFGGLISAVGVGVLAGWLQGGSILVWAGLGAVVSVTGVFGDLVESMLKRSVNIKDSGTIMPGHGGFLDRFDALLLSAPFVFIYYTIFEGL